MEKTLFDRYFSGYLLKKRKIWKPFKYNISPTFTFSRWMDAILMPQTKFEKLISNLAERCLPTLTYFTWRDQMINAREEGWTIQEKFFNHFFRQKNIYYHAYSQQLHPWSYIDRQRADQFYRRLQTLLPGCECPAWGRQNRRVPDIDFDSLFNVASSYNQVAQEATPTPHYNTPNYFVVQHFFNNRNNFGVNGSRLFFNEQPRGDFSTTGYYSKRDLEMIDSWFASDKNVIIHKIMNMSEEDRKCSISSLEKWKKNIEIYFPETKQMKVEPVTHKFADEPYHSRNIDELRDKVFIQKYMDSRKSFNQREIRQIKEVFLEGVDNHFFEKSELDEQYHGTKLFNKFTNLFDLPDYFSCTTKSGKLPEVQFMNKIEVRWNINFHTVAVAKETFYSLVKEFETKNQFYKFLSHSYLAESDKLRIHREIRILISEEIYNPLFSSKLESTATNGIGLVSQSINNLDDINNLIELVNQTKEEIKFLNRKAFVNFLVRNRRILQSIPFIPIS